MVSEKTKHLNGLEAMAMRFYHERPEVDRYVVVIDGVGSKAIERKNLQFVGGAQDAPAPVAAAATLAAANGEDDSAPVFRSLGAASSSSSGDRGGGSAADDDALEKEVVLNLYQRFGGVNLLTVTWRPTEPEVFYHLSRAGMGGYGRAPRELPPAFYNVVRGVVDVVNDRIYGEYWQLKTSMLIKYGLPVNVD